MKIGMKPEPPHRPDMVPEWPTLPSPRETGRAQAWLGLQPSDPAQPSSMVMDAGYTPALCGALDGWRRKHLTSLSLRSSQCKEEGWEKGRGGERMTKGKGRGGEEVNVCVM